MSLTYLSYLKVDELLRLQKLQSHPEEHDEMLFIIIHQTYELWFKQVLHEVELLRNQLEFGETWSAIKTMRRILVIMKTLVGQTDILETMTPLSFNQFRKFLQNSSGFQSVQFRELEILCGLRTKRMISVHETGSDAYNTIISRMDEPIIWESFVNYLQKRGYPAPMPKRVNDNGLVFNPSDELQQVLVEVMQKDNEAALLCELLVDFDEGMQEWRYRHVKMVERTIGTKKGSGGSDGVEYLKSTLHHHMFPDLWAIRTQF
ncbi:MAG TPA: tryptophan 2,3-dioxygenase [Bacteroidetes bacterium]|nr:tryptophan 2,3-dioxygenase [Bacteroidota bacterium]